MDLFQLKLQRRERKIWVVVIFNVYGTDKLKHLVKRVVTIRSWRHSPAC